MPIFSLGKIYGVPTFAALKKRFGMDCEIESISGIWARDHKTFSFITVMYRMGR